MNKKIIPFVFLFAVIACLLFLAQKRFQQQQNSSTPIDKLTITASFYPLAEFAQQIGKDKMSVYNLTPPGAEPHDFDPSPQDLVKIQNSKLFIYNGAGLELWISKIPDEVKKNTLMINSSEGISLRQSTEQETTNQKANTDPHVWMNPILAIKEVENIKNGFIKVDPKNQQFYETNAATYEKQLIDLDQQFTQGLAHCALKDIVTSHNAFEYFAQEYHLNVLGISGLSPDEEPSPQKMADVVQFSKQHNVKYIFFESLVSPQLSQTIATETGAQTIAFNPLEGLTPNEIAQGKNYITVQQENLKSLRTALQCQ